MFPFPLAQTVTLYRRADLTTDIDDHGNAVENWGNGEEIAVYAWSPPSADSEELIAGDVIERRLDVYAPPPVGEIVSPFDRMSVDGDLFEVMGHPSDFGHGFHGWQPGVVVRLQRVEG